jgi:histidinol-phosphatase
VSADLTRELALAHELADLSDALTLPGFHRDLDVDRKEDGSAVTAVDLDVERALRARIREAFPRHAVLGEEDGLDGPAGAPTWILDPIDGTTNFIRGNPIFATLIALRVDERDVLGVVSAPALGSRWDGVVGQGAHQDGRPVRVSSVDRLADAEIAFGGLNHFQRKGWLGVVGRAAETTRRQRGYGDFWQHMLVAAGACDIAMEAEVNTWDLAAVRAIVEAAGGRFTSLDGHPTADGGSACSSNGLLHDAALALLEG